MKEYFQESVLSTISTSRSKMENARYIPLGILLYIRERWVQIAASDTTKVFLLIMRGEEEEYTRTQEQLAGIIMNTNSLL